MFCSSWVSCKVQADHWTETVSGNKVKRIEALGTKLSGTISISTNVPLYKIGRKLSYWLIVYTTLAFFCPNLANSSLW